jgi:hypothetical protein
MKKKEVAPTEVTGEAKDMIALAFEGIGGLPKLIQWARTHQTAFYSAYTKLLPLQVSASVSHKVDEEQERAALKTAFLSVINANARQAARLGTADRGGVIIEHKVIEHEPTSSKDEVMPHRPASPAPDSGPGQPPRSTPKLVVEPPAASRVARSSGPDIPGLAAGAAFDGLDDNLTTTEKYLLWNGRMKPP